MRFLKTKISLARQALDKKPLIVSLSIAPVESKEVTVPKIIKVESIPFQQQQQQQHQQKLLQPAPNLSSKSKQTVMKKSSSSSKKQIRKTRLRKSRADMKGNNSNLRPTKNVVINFGKAIATFATSHLAIPYLEDLFHKENITADDFSSFINDAKNKIGGIESFRSLLLPANEEKESIAACKKVFIGIAEIFIKYFSVNWIIHGRVTHKMTYLKYRFKILRRIQNPELFTYISEGRKKCQ